MALRRFLHSTPAIQVGNLVRTFTCPAIASFLSLIATSQPGQALTFNFDYADQTPQQAITAFEEAGSIWAGYLHDDITLNIDVSYGELPNGMLGGARPNMVRANWADVIQQFEQDQSSSDDITALPHLQDLDTVYLDSKKNRIDFDDSSSLWLTRSNAKALGIVAGGNLTSDGEIRLSDLALWDFDPSDDIASDHYDFTATALHEIGHVLGFVSGVDILDLHQQSLVSEGQNPREAPIYVTSMDLFRHSGKIKRKDGRDLTLDNRKKYFSLNDGATRIGYFSNGLSTGSSAGGYQASHWKAGEDGIMQPSLKPGEQNSISSLDLRLMDALGWDLTGDSNVDYFDSSVSYTAYNDSFDGLLSRGRSSSGNANYRYWQTGLESFSEGSSMNQPVPEPMSTLTLLGLGVLGIWTSLLKRNNSAAP